jgi:hypothetical protein
LTGFKGILSGPYSNVVKVLGKPGENGGVATMGGIGTGAKEGNTGHRQGPSRKDKVTIQVI